MIEKKPKPSIEVIEKAQANINGIPNYTHVIDWDLIKSTEDVVVILKSMQIRFDPKMFPMLPELQKYLVPMEG